MDCVGGQTPYMFLICSNSQGYGSAPRCSGPRFPRTGGAAYFASSRRSSRSPAKRPSVPAGMAAHQDSIAQMGL